MSLCAQIALVVGDVRKKNIPNGRAFSETSCDAVGECRRVLETLYVPRGGNPAIRN